MIKKNNFRYVWMSALVLLLMFGSGLQGKASSGEISETTVSEDSYVYVYLQNKCPRDVKYEIQYAGQGSSGSIYKNEKKRMTLQPGAKIYIDGEFFMEVKVTDDGETFVVCR